MSFDGLSDTQRELIADLIERLASADYTPRFTVEPRPDSSYTLTLNGVGGTADADLLVPHLSELDALRQAGYLTLTPAGSKYVGELSHKAYEEYKSSTSSPGAFGLIPVQGPASDFDDEHLERIAARSEKLLIDLRKNFALYRRQASMSFVWTLVISTVGMVLLSSGVALALIGKAGTVNLASISGVLTEFLAAIFFKQAAEARNAQDRIQQALLSRQRIFDLVELTRLISDKQTRDTVTQELIKSFVLGSPQHSPED